MRVTSHANNTHYMYNDLSPCFWYTGQLLVTSHANNTHYVYNDLSTCFCYTGHMLVTSHANNTYYMYNRLSTRFCAHGKCLSHHMQTTPIICIIVCLPASVAQGLHGSRITDDGEVFLWLSVGHVLRRRLERRSHLHISICRLLRGHARTLLLACANAVQLLPLQ